jgi:hypothetical protein
MKTEHGDELESSGSSEAASAKATKQTSLTYFVNAGPSGPSKLGKMSEQQQHKIDNALYKLIVGKVLPVSLVENDFFREFVHLLDAR